ncbi:AAA family ATPase [Leucobacter weissii]|uniref:AAA family ATPase n=1 Tax=Leucobacter weissii TaxID=1983706 RepID=A0A939SCX0_9MICO|nr:AAA family ATPase [Leucobacter weissii]
MSRPDLSPEQLAVYERIEHTREHVFVTGRAGTGKSTILNHLAHRTSKILAVCAPTGVAALNVGGQTIHSLLRLPTGVIADHDLDQPSELKKMLASIDTLVIDEISMVSADLMDAIDRSLRQARGRRHDPFGGVQIIMFGDPYQLPPVPPRDPHERAYYADTYRSLWFFDARVWADAPIAVIELAEVHRQRDDRFKQILGAVRHGEVTEDMAEDLNAAGARPAPREVLTLATTNATVTRLNQQRLAEITGDSLRAVAEVNGEFRENAYPADEVLELKPGAQVMFLRNDPDGRWVNGTIGRVSRVAGTVWVDVDGAGGGTEEFEVEPTVWERYRYRYDAESKKLEKEVVAEFEQFPLRLAWAVTIHKSQGHTYDAAVVDLGPRAFSAGQSYVALSRVRSLDGLYLRRPLQPADVIVDPNVVRFMRGRG